MTTIQDVKELLLSKKDNFTARRWAKDDRILNEILERHNEWNEDHIKIKQYDMVFPLEVNVDSYLDNPSIIDENKEPTE